MIVDIEIDDLTAYSITEDNEMNISFSLAKIHNICQYNKMAKEIEIKLMLIKMIKIIFFIFL